jgi:hypothetical protein
MVVVGMGVGMVVDMVVDTADQTLLLGKINRHLI